MKRYLIAAISCLALIVGVSPAAAGDGLGGILPTLTQTTQENTNRSGDAAASNQNGTWQGNGQSQTGYGGDATTGGASTGGTGCCGSGGDATSGDAYGGDVTQSQEAENANSTTQEATATSKATQVLPVNVNVPICVSLKCETGDVEQSNANSSGDAAAWNENHTGQSNEQTQKGVGGDATSGDATAGSGDAETGKAVGGDVDQSQRASNANETTQSATATSKATQVLPVNANVPVCIAKYCETGDVEQSNTNRSGDAAASNANATWQENDQSQWGFGGDATSGDATTGKGGCCGSGGDATSGDAYGGDVTQSQEASNANRTSQEASSTSKAKQFGAINVNVPVCVAFHCKTGDVDQSNRNSSGDASAWNVNRTGQSNEQSQKGVGGDATSGDATTGQGGCCSHPEKPYCEVRQPKQYGGTPCKDDPKGDDDGPSATSGKAVGGDVTQSQGASNSNETTQSATATSKAKQFGAINANVPVCVALHCKTGDVDQSNRNHSGDASAWNVNRTGQSNEQSQKGVGGDARSGDATAQGGCCDHGKGKPAPCQEQHPKPYGEKPCKDGGPKGAHGPSAESGKAVGGDVDQRQQAQNANRTAQDAEATSKAKQFGALNLALPIAPGQHGGPVCRSC